MNRDETLQYLYDIKLVENYTKKLAYECDWDIMDDIIQQLWLQICEVKDEKWEDLWSQGTKNDAAKAVRGFVSGIIYRSVRSKNSRLYYALKKYKEKEVLCDDIISNYGDIADESEEEF